MGKKRVRNSRATGGTPWRRAPMSTLLCGCFLFVASGLQGCAPVISSSGADAASGTAAEDRVIIDPSVVRRTIPQDFFGINFVGFWDEAAGSHASAQALAQTPIRTVRFPGGAPADWYDWQDPYYKGWSHTTPLQLWRYVRSFGGKHVVFGTNYQGHIPNPPGKSYAVNSPQNAAAWVAYDAKKGIASDMEVGNEEDMNLLHKADDPAYSVYTDRFNAQASAMHRANPHVRVLGPVGTNEYFWWGLDGLGTFLRGAGNKTGKGQVDGISLHFYKGSSWLDTRGVAQYWLQSDGPWAAIQKSIRANDTRRLPVYITEWNIGGADQKSAFEPTLGHALVTADMLGAFAISGVAVEDYFDTHGAHTWGLLYGQGEDRPLDSATPTYYALALWSHMASRMIDLQQSDDSASVMSTYATLGKNGSVQVLAINKQPTSRRVAISFQGASPAGHRLRVYTLRAATPNIDTVKVLYDGASMPSPQRPLPGPKDLGPVRGRTVSFNVPGYSAVVLDLSGTSKAKSIHWGKVSTGAAAPPLAFTVNGGVGHADVKRGMKQTLSATVVGNQDASSILTDLEVYDSTGAKVFQTAKEVDLQRDKQSRVSAEYTVPTAARVGIYTFKIGIFGPNWNPLYVWKDHVASFNVVS